VQAGPLALVGGDEFRPGNEETDRVLISNLRPGTGYVLATAAARQDPGKAVGIARAWFAGLGVAVEELPVRRRADALSQELAAQARAGTFFYLTGGDPGLVVDVLRDSPVWDAIVGAWRRGAALAGSSAGAMALGEWTLLRERWPNHARRRFAAALGLIPRVAVVPHFDTAGRRWRAASPPDGSILLAVDARTAALWTGDEWRAVGPGRAAVLGTEQAVRGLPPPLVASPDP
jgi:cyanophycinase